MLINEDLRKNELTKTLKQLICTYYLTNLCNFTFRPFFIQFCKLKAQVQKVTD